MDDIYGGKYEPKTNLRLGKVCKKNDINCEKRRKSFFSSIAKMKNPKCPDGSFVGIPSQSLRNLVGLLNIPKRKNKSKVTLCKMLKDYETKNKIDLMNIYGKYRNKVKTIYKPIKRLNYIEYEPIKNSLSLQIEPKYRSYDYLLKNDIIKNIPEWLDDRRKGIKKTIKKRGRPKKIIEEVVPIIKRPRGRPKKNIEEVKPILQPIKQPMKKPIIVNFY
jgi:hypothetical protein